MVSQASAKIIKQTLWNTFKYVLAFGLLAWVVWANWAPPSGHGLGYVWHKHVVLGEPIHWGYLSLAFVIVLGSILLTFVRWYILVRAVDLPFRLRDALRLGMIGFFFNTFLPGSVGGDIIKAAFLAREQSRRTVAVATVIMDRALALWALFWFVAILGGIFWVAGALQEGTQRLALLSGVLVACSVPVWVLLGFLSVERAERFAGRLSRLPRVGGTAAEFWRAVWMYRCRQRSVAITLLLSWIGHAGFVLSFYFSVLAVWVPEYGPLPSLAEHYLLVPYGLLIQAFPLFPGGVGAGEAAFGGLYKLVGAQPSLGVLGCLVQRVINWILGVCGYVVYLWMKPDLTPAAVTPALPVVRQHATELIALQAR